MVEQLITQEKISQGKLLLKALDEQKFNIKSSFWILIPESNDWKLIFSTNKLNTIGPKHIYKKIQSIIQNRNNKINDIHLNEIGLIDENGHLHQLFRTALRTGNGIGEIRFRNNYINGVLINDAIIYRVT